MLRLGEQLSSADSLDFTATLQTNAPLASDSASSQIRSPSSCSMPAQPMANIGSHFAYLPTKIVNPCL